jgi:hypothetical protein
MATLLSITGGTERYTVDINNQQSFNILDELTFSKSNYVNKFPVFMGKVGSGSVIAER